MTHPGFSVSRRDMLTLAVVYVLAYGWFLAYTDFLPYVFDNNESFSAFVHGSNLYHFGLEKSYGLTDEAYGPDAAAHPYVYTHQGNFPRIVSFLMYAGGIRTVETQIAVSTVTIGLATIALIYLFFARVAGRAYGAIAASLFMTDYILSVQWQVNTFKVWHGFLLFAMLASIQQFGHDRRALWLLPLGVASLCVGYFDLLMAVFTFVLCTVYASILFARRDKAALASSVGTMFLGGLASVAIFIVQLLGYYGWEGLRQDLYLTFVGRNYAESDPAAIRNWQRFFIEHRIVFWEALVDSRPFASLAAAIKAIFQYGFSVVTPYLTFLVFALAGAPLAALLLRFGATRGRVGWRVIALAAMVFALPTLYLGKVGAVIAVPFAVLVFVGPFCRTAATQRAFLRWCFFAAWFGVNFVLFVVCLTDAVDGRADRLRLPSLGGAINATALLVALAAIAAVLFGAISWRPFRLNVREGKRSIIASLRLLAAGGYCALLAIYALGHQGLFHIPEYSYAPVWNYVLEPWTPSGSTKFLATAVVATGVIALLKGTSATGVHRTGTGRSLVGYLVAALAGYLAAYFFSPGYMVLINLKRHVPVLVFLLLPLVALGAWSLLRMLFGLRHRPLGATLAVLAGIHLLIYWFGLQGSYLRLIPPDAGVVFANLDKPPYAHASFVVNSYGAPVAANTGNWAYIDQKFVAAGEYVLDADGYRPAGRDIYKWFADRDHPRYRFPEYALCFDMPGFHHAMRALEIRDRNKSMKLSLADIYHPRSIDQCAAPDLGTTLFACDGKFQAQNTETHVPGTPAMVQVDRDASLLHRWSIHKLEADFPPFLAATNGPAAPRVRVALARRGKDCIVNIGYDYRQQQGEPESGSMMRAWVHRDGRAPSGMQETYYVGAPVESLRIDPAARGKLYVSVTPATATRTGETFVSPPLDLEHCGR